MRENGLSLLKNEKEVGMRGKVTLGMWIKVKRMREVELSESKGLGWLNPNSWEKN